MRCPHRAAPLGRGLPSATAAPASAPCFRRRRRSPLQLFESSLAASRKIVYKIKKTTPKRVLPAAAGGANLWPLESENSDIQTETASGRDSLPLLHKVVRCAKRRQSLFPCPLAALRGVGSQIAVSPAQSWRYAALLGHPIVCCQQPVSRSVRFPGNGPVFA